MKKNLSIVRKFLLWWFSPPNSPWVNVNLSVDFTHAISYLEQLNQDSSLPKITVQHLLCASMTRALLEVPEANSRIVGGKIISQKHIGIAMPVIYLDMKRAKNENFLFFCSRIPKIKVSACWRKKVVEISKKNVLDR